MTRTSLVPVFSILLFVALVLPVGVAQSQTDTAKPTVRWMLHPERDLSNAIFSHDGSLALLSETGGYAIYDIASHATLGKVPADYFHAVFSADDQFIYYLAKYIAPETHYYDSTKPVQNNGMPYRMHHDSAWVTPGSVELWIRELATGTDRRVAVLPTFRSRLVFGPGGARLYEVDRSSFVRVLANATGDIISESGTRGVPVLDEYPGLIIDRIAGIFASIDPVIESPDGRYAAIVKSQDSMAIYSLSPLRKIVDLPNIRFHQSYIAIAFAPSHAIAFAPSHALAILQDTAFTIDLPDGSFHTAATMPALSSALAVSDREIYAISLEKGRRSWDVTPEQVDTLVRIDPTDLSIRSVMPLRARMKVSHYFANTRTLLLSGEQFAESYHIDSHLRDTLHTSTQTIVGVKLSDKRHSLLSTAWGSGWELRETRAGRIKSFYSEPNHGPLAIDPVHDRMLTSKGNDSVVLGVLSTGHKLRAFYTGNYPRSAGFSHDGTHVAWTSVMSSSLRSPGRGLISTVGAQVWAVNGLTPEDVWTNLPFYARVQFLRDDRTLMLYGGDTMVILRRGTAEPVRAFVGHIHEVEQIALSSDEQWMTSRDRGGRTYTWRMSDGQIKGVWQAPRESTILTLTPNDRYLLVNSGHDLIPVDMHTGEQLAPILTLPSTINSISFSEDGRSFALGGQYGELSVWESPASWVQAESKPIDLKHSYLPLRWYIPATARAAYDNGQPYTPPRTDVLVELLDEGKNVVRTVTNGSLHTGKWHIWEWDATDLPAGTYYMRAVIGGAETWEKYELRK